jgi:DNA-binding transcriptional LysR family regulator
VPFIGAACVPGSDEHGEPKVPADLTAHQAVVYDVRAGGTAWAFRKGGAEISVNVTGRVRFTAAEGVREAVFSGLGLAVASERQGTGLRRVHRRGAQQKRFRGTVACAPAARDAVAE